MQGKRQQATHPVPPPPAAWAALHGGVLLFGAAGLFGQWIALPPLMIVFGRLLFAALVLAPLVAYHRGGPWPRGVEGWLLVGCGALLAGHWLAFFRAIQLGGVAVGLVGFATAPVFAALLEPGWFRERFSPVALVAALVTVAGTLVIVAGEQGGAGGGALPGLVWGIGAGGSFALLALANRALRRRHGSLAVLFCQDAAALAMVAPLAAVWWHPPTPGDWALLALLGVVCTALAHGLFIGALRGVTARAATLVGNLEPLYGIALALLLLGERPTAQTLAGGGLILASAAAATLAHRPPKPRRSTPRAG